MKLPKIVYLLIMMVLVTQTKAQRINKTIHTGWLFQKGEVSINNGIENPDDWERINLPHTWNSTDDSDDESGFYQGPGWYAKVLRIPAEWAEKQVYIHFEGANQETDVYMNGEKVGNHKGGYTAFSFHLSPHLKYDDNNLLMVRVTNEIDEDIPPLRADFTFYGGIYRNVRLIVTETVHFDMNNHASEGIFTQLENASNEKADVAVTGKIVNSLPQNSRIRFETRIIDQNNTVVASESQRINLSAGEEFAFQTEPMEIVNPNLWSPDDPYLYRILVQIFTTGRNEQLLDEMILPLGVRWFDFDDQNRFVLNGEPLKLIGANRHQDLPEKGNALSDDDHRRDFEKIKEMGFNFVRLAHYPQAKEIYRLCDELGLLVWTEIPIVVHITQSEAFTNNSMNMMREQIRQTINNPSVVFYGYMNELMLRFNGMTEEERVLEGAATVELAEKLERLTEEEAPLHKTVMAVHFYEGYNKYGLADVADVLGWNLYFGWYYHNMEDLTPYLAEQHELYPNRPLILSEYGPGADVRNRTESPMAWDFTEDYQMLMHQSYLDQMMNMDFLAGFAAWNFADFGSERRKDAIPHVNQKGLVNFDRSEKNVAFLYRAYFSDKPVLHIALQDFTQQGGIEDEKGKAASTHPVKVFSNAGEVELFVNGQSIGTKQVEKHVVVFDVPFHDGLNKLEAVDNNGLKASTDVDYTLYTIPLATSVNNEIAVNVGSHFSFYDPDTRIMWMADREYTSGMWGYQGGAPYISPGGRKPKPGTSDNILGVNNDPLFQTYNEGIGGYQFDVKDGLYEVTLCFVEPESRNREEEIIFNLSDNVETDLNVGNRVFHLDINNTRVLNNLNLAREFGPLRGVTYTFQVITSNGDGIKLQFDPIEGEPVLSAIRVKPM
jgi:beta-galactosidase